jgi:hypothetical protein
LSEESKLVVETTLAGEIIGEPLDVSVATQPEGIYFIPSTGEMILVSEPNEMLFFKPQIDTDAPTEAPIEGGAAGSPAADPTSDDDSSAMTHSYCLAMPVLLLAACFFIY